MKHKATTNFQKEKMTMETTGVGGDFVDGRTYDWKGYIPSPSLRYFHPSDKEYVPHQLEKRATHRKKLRKTLK